MSNRVLVACLQLTTTNDEEQNWQQILELSERAIGYGAQVLALPENCLYEGHPLCRIQDIEGVWKPRFRELAKQHKVSILCGSLREETEAKDKDLSYNTTLVMGPEGNELGRYRKMHLFDVDLPEGPKHLESSYLKAGNEAVVCDIPGLGVCGLTICYDLRFPELYRSLVREHGARVLFVPSSFTLMTGRDHWLQLLQARAIENQCFVIAPNQWGVKGKLAKYGRSAIIDPWGTVIATASDGAGLCLAELDFAKLEKIRAGLPVHEHARLI